VTLVLIPRFHRDEELAREPRGLPLRHVGRIVAVAAIARASALQMCDRSDLEPQAALGVQRIGCPSRDELAAHNLFPAKSANHIRRLSDLNIADARARFPVDLGVDRKHARRVRIGNERALVAA
jgi:hypothetical protein